MELLTNCKNCGAVLHGNKCEYCGTEYGSACGADNDKLLTMITDLHGCSELYRETIHRFSDEHHLDVRQMLADLRDMPDIRWNEKTLSFSVPPGTRLEWCGADLLVYQDQYEANIMARYFSPGGWRRRLQRSL